MKDSGLFALCGIPGSGKTLNATYYALKHYKKENRLYILNIIYYLTINILLVQMD